MDVTGLSNDWAIRVLPAVLAADLVVVKRKAREEGTVYTSEVKPVVKTENTALEYRTGPNLDVNV